MKFEGGVKIHYLRILSNAVYFGGMSVGRGARQLTRRRMSVQRRCRSPSRRFVAGENERGVKLHISLLLCHQRRVERRNNKHRPGVISGACSQPHHSGKGIARPYRPEAASCRHLPRAIKPFARIVSISSSSKCFKSQSAGELRERHILKV